MNKIDVVKALGERTCIGINRCRIALEACNWNIDLAHEWLKADNYYSHDKKRLIGQKARDVTGSQMSPWEKKLDDWCYANLDCNLNAWQGCDFRSPELMDKFIAFVVNAVPKGATHFAKNVEVPLDYGLYSVDQDWEIK